MAFLIPCTEMRSTESSWAPSPAQEDEVEDEGTTMDSEPGPSMGTMSPPGPPPTPSLLSPTQTVPAVQEASQQPRHKRRRTERHEDRLIACLDALAHPVPKLSCDALFLLSLEDKMGLVARNRVTQVREEVTKTIDKFIYPYEMAPSIRAPQQAPLQAPQQPAQYGQQYGQQSGPQSGPQYGPQYGPLHPQHAQQHPHTYPAHTYTQSNIQHPLDTWQTQHTSYPYPSTSTGPSTSTTTTTEMPPANQSHGARETQRDPDAEVSGPQFETL
ncbi:uncharacterized protein LOC122933754 [Bufo gargarizans]|uniref:uncharacterized protein LOC122933754 n=1 Tax=Bufo gargarizans TaxID=30331 RepID=UPI001CF1B0BB|nr:uncharacterized protein LOC122933754 [Bufo gargarizans]